MKKYLVFLIFILVCPHVFFFSLSKRRQVIVKDVERWMECMKLHVPFRGVK